MNFIKTAHTWLLLLALTVPACGDHWTPPELFRVLQATWCSYRQIFISPEGRVLLPERDGGTISEAQAYALLRAVWAGDEATFARVYAWTQQNLSRPDHLLAWQWGRRVDGSWGVLDANTASDGDLDYALALILAARRGWRAPMGLPDYLGEAREVAAGILAKEVAALPGGTLVLTAGDWHETGPPYLLNPSYFSPAAYRLFAQIGAGPVGAVREPPAWDRLQQDTYQLLAHLSQGLGATPGVGLFPDWCRVDAAGRFSPAPGRETHYGWEAVRLPWRLALYSLWFDEPRTTQLLKQKFLPFFKQEWQTKGKLAAVYRFDGVPVVDYESPVLYAGVLAAAKAGGDREFAAQMAQKIQSFYHEKDGLAYFVSPDNYYANNWAWLGLAMYAGWVKP
ncbi:MAG: glycosyl hydrolase family 8 [Deltaproteobacteria bacterium]|nr:glycosyl hydrolase family 8 [Deltaproteobacteria bacterium]